MASHYGQPHPLLICRQYGDDWEDRFFAELGSSQADSEQDDDPEEEGQFDLEPPPAIEDHKVSRCHIITGSCSNFLG